MTIASALFTDSQSRLFQWLFGQQSGSFYLSELRRLTGPGSASLQRELNRLADASLVSSQRKGNLRRFRASPDSPVYPELINPVCYPPAEFQRRRAEPDSFINRVLAQPVISLMEKDHEPAGI